MFPPIPKVRIQSNTNPGETWGKLLSKQRKTAWFDVDNEKLVIRGGAMGETVLDEGGIKALADLPSLDELRGKIVGMLNTPATRIAQVLSAPGGQVARVIAAKAEQGDAA